MLYQILPQSDMWQKLYSTIEEEKKQLKLADFSVSQSTLEQVYSIYTYIIIYNIIYVCMYIHYIHYINIKYYIIIIIYSYVI